MNPEKRRMFRNIKAALVKFCDEIIKSEGLDGFIPFDFDQHAVINDPPDQDLIGPGELSISNGEKTYTVSCKIAVCSNGDDAGLEKLNRAIDALFDVLQPGYNGIKVIRFDDGRIVGNLSVMDGVTVLPVGATRGRPLQAIAVTFASSMIVPP